MSKPQPRAFLRLVVATALAVSTAFGPSVARGATIATFVPIGAGYAADTLEQFAAEAAEVDTSGTVSILVLPITSAKAEPGKAARRGQIPNSPPFATGSTASSPTIRRS